MVSFPAYPQPCEVEFILIKENGDTPNRETKNAQSVGDPYGAF